MSKNKDNNNHGIKDDDLELMLLKTTNNEYELGLIKALLEDNNIPFIVRDYESGGYMRLIGGSSIYRTDILVEESMFEKAKDILEQVPPEVFND